jgi:hypothetical protein
MFCANLFASKDKKKKLASIDPVDAEKPKADSEDIAAQIPSESETVIVKSSILAP